MTQHNQSKFRALNNQILKNFFSISATIPPIIPPHSWLAAKTLASTSLKKL